MSAQIKGWCPSAHRPMMSGDGLLVRVHPRKARLEAAQVHALCALANTFGNGMIDITSRANLQIRGVTQSDYPDLLDRLISENLVEADPAKEAAASVTVTPFWLTGDLTDRLVQGLENVEMTDLPDKMGIVIDTGPEPILSDTSGDFRFEIGANGGLILRAEGAKLGRPISEDDAATVFSEMVTWFLQTGGVQSGRMARHLQIAALPQEWQTEHSARSEVPPEPGAAYGGHLYGVPFGQTDATSLAQLMHDSGASHLRVTPWRMLFLEDAVATDGPGFLSRPDPLLSVAACPGAPACAQASVPTRDLARRLAGRVIGTLHVSGCEKGCARRTPAEITLVGRNGRFELVHNGSPGDTPAKQALSQADVLELLS